MIISVASGKGGTGKTTISTNMAISLGDECVLLDCDVEEPNAHLFLHPRIDRSETVTTFVPEVDEERCTFCRKCADICRFRAIAVVGKKVLVFPQLCHSCGGCLAVCPEEAITEGSRELGVVEWGDGAGVAMIQGRLRVGEAMSPPLIKKVRSYADPDLPGRSSSMPRPVLPARLSPPCAGADFVLLVTEPTPFGLHDLQLAVEAVRVLGIPCGLVINRADMGDGQVLDYARQEGLPVLLEIPFDRRIAEAYSRGMTIVEEMPEWRQRFRELFQPDQHGNHCRKPEGRNAMREMVVVSGKGGTGKTSLTAAFASLAGENVLCDADVDAADLHLLLKPEVRRRTDFMGGGKAVIDPGLCTRCGLCRDLCRFAAIDPDYLVDGIACEGCGVCVDLCPAQAIDFPVQKCGEWFISDTRLGPMVHARLGIAEENSGKLVSCIRQEARKLAEERGLELIITDGPPGIGCPVIAAIGGATALALIVEPTVSGLHDMTRLADLAAHFRVPCLLCVNKFDLNVEMTEKHRGNGAAAQDDGCRPGSL